MRLFAAPGSSWRVLLAAGTAGCIAASPRGDPCVCAWAHCVCGQAFEGWASGAACRDVSAALHSPPGAPATYVACLHRVTPSSGEVLCANRSCVQQTQQEAAAVAVAWPPAGCCVARSGGSGLSMGAAPRSAAWSAMVMGRAVSLPRPWSPGWRCHEAVAAVAAVCGAVLG